MPQSKYDKIVKMILEGVPLKDIREIVKVTTHDIDTVRARSYKLQYVIMDGVKHRYCSSCRNLLKYTREYFSARQKDGTLGGRCLACDIVKSKVYYIDNKEKFKIKGAKYRKTEEGKEVKRKRHLKFMDLMRTDEDFAAKRKLQNKINRRNLEQRKLKNKITEMRENLTN